MHEDLVRNGTVVIFEPVGVEIPVIWKAHSVLIPIRERHFHVGKMRNPPLMILYFFV